MDNTIKHEAWHDFYHYAERGDVIFYYLGYFSQTIIAAMADSVKLRLEHNGAAGMTRRKLFSTFIEMAQNIIHYSADAHQSTPPDTAAMCHGAVFISKKGEHYQLHCANPVRADLVGQLREKLEHLRAMTIDEIKQEYKEMLRAETPAGSKGAGLGLLTVARDASEPLEFAFSPVTPAGNAMFYLKVTI
jgi:hypothetical protein